MKIRRFYSNNMRNALRQVTEEFGEEAAILSSQKTPSGVEVIAALDYDEELVSTQLNELNKKEQVNQKNIEGNRETMVEREPQPIDEGLQESKNIEQIDEHRKDKLIETLQAATESPIYNGVVGEGLQSQRTKANTLEWSTDPGLAAMREELGLMRSMMSEQLKGLGWERFSEKQPIKAMLKRRFASLGVCSSIGEPLIAKVSPGQDAECSWQNLLVLLSKSINTTEQNLFSAGGVYAFMGPTGAGKTTSIAKIAARFVIKHGTESVGLISTDNYRISAQQQLASFARLLGIPVATVTSTRSIDYLINQFNNKKLILIDTAGMSKNDLSIAKQLDSLSNTSREIKRFLLMPATNQLAVLQQSIELFKPYSPYSVIISKLDEAASLGEVLSLLIKNNLPVAFTTDGQRVPEDIRLARNHHLVSKAVWLTNKYGKNAEDWQLAQDHQMAQYG
jgi:flagellar biosynthesis protein FlhF